MANELCMVGSGGEIDIIDVLYTNKLVEQALLDTVEPLSKDKMEAPL